MDTHKAPTCKSSQLTTRRSNFSRPPQEPQKMLIVDRWRHFIPLLPQNAPIFAADLPGYGASAAISSHDKLTVGNAILSALKTEVKRTSSSPSASSIPIVLIGHDRGARVSHRLAVDGVSGFDIKGVCLIDIVFSSTQYHSLGTHTQC